MAADILLLCRGHINPLLVDVHYHVWGGISRSKVHLPESHRACCTCNVQVLRCYTGGPLDESPHKRHEHGRRRLEQCLYSLCVAIYWMVYSRCDHFDIDASIPGIRCSSLLRLRLLLLPLPANVAKLTTT